MSIRKGKEIYDAAERNDHIELQKLIAKPDSYLYYQNGRNNKMNALHIASLKNNIRCVETLLLAGYDIELKSNNDYNAVHYSIIGNAYIAFIILINMGANVNVKCNNQNLLDICARFRRLKECRILIQSGIDMNRQVINTANQIANENNCAKEFLAVLMLSNVNILPLITCSNEAKAALLDTTQFMIKTMNNSTNVLLNKIRSYHNITPAPSENIFKLINKIETLKYKFINVKYNDSTYELTYKYNMSLIKALEIAISTGMEKTITACIDARIYKKRDKTLKYKQYIAIRCIAKIGELNEKLAYHKQKLDELTIYLNKNKLTMFEIYKFIENNKITTLKR